MAETDEGPVYVPFTVAGDVARIRFRDGRGELRGILEAGASRRKPACRHFGQCGGCALQHVDVDVYLDWKRRNVIDALTQRGIMTSVVNPIVAIPPGDRRRAGLTAMRRAGVVTVGYNIGASHDVIDLVECPLIDSKISKEISGLRALVREVLKHDGRLSMTVTTTLNGLDVAIQARQIESWDLSWEARKGISDVAARLDLARLSINEEILILRKRPALRLSGCEVVPPPGAFLQASPNAEAILTQLVLDGVGRAKRVADLFAGCGTFSLALARQARVLAVDNESAMLEALDAAASKTAGLKAVETDARNLFDRPLVASELASFDAVVFDPPRAGARAQAEVLARSSVKQIVAVSCNPATFARDARLLIDGGYSLTSVTPVDQFVWSPHIELIGVLAKK